MSIVQKGFGDIQGLCIFQDENFDSDEKEIVCRYPQFFATRLLRESVIKSVKTKAAREEPTLVPLVAERPTRWHSLPVSFRCDAQQR